MAQELKAKSSGEIRARDALLGYWWYEKSEADKVIAHHKYKRCLAMARWCERKRIDAADYRIPREKWKFYDRWHKRWLELAEKFKEGVQCRG